MSLWESILKSATNNTTTPVADLFILGPNPQAQRTLINQLSTSRTSSKNKSSQNSGLRIANALGLGYSYVDFKDESDFVVSHVDIHTLDLPDTANHDTYSNLLKHALTRSRTQGHRCLVIIALDWYEPDLLRSWTQQLATWVGILKHISSDLDLDDVNQELSKRLQTYISDDSSTDMSRNQHHLSKQVLSNLEIPLDEGQFNSPLGVDLVVATIGSEYITKRLEGTADDLLDLLQQLIRAVVLKHGGSMVYVPSNTTTTIPAIRALISERLQLPVRSSVPEKCPISIVDQTQICIPAGWDSKGKINALRDRFPYEEFDESWDKDPESTLSLVESLVPEDYSSYTMVGQSLKKKSTRGGSKDATKEEISKPDFQTLLAEQYDVLQKISSEVSKNVKELESEPLSASVPDMNISGIQVERVEEVLRRLKAREQSSVAQISPTASPLRTSPDVPTNPSSPGNENERLASFFQGLLDRNKKAATST